MIELYPNGTIVNGSQCNLTRKGRPLDLTATPWGFAAYIRYDLNSKSTVLAMYSNCTLKFEKTIMNNENGISPQVAKDQLMFYDSMDPLSQPFGMAVMYDPHNGRLAYARERLGLIFAHYNNFGGGEGHTGSTFVSLDEINGNDAKLGFSWGCSHSLNQVNFWDGEQFMTASLGDAYPMNIAVSRCEGVQANGWREEYTGKANRLDCSGSSDLISGIIAGDGGGNAAGRLGGLIALNETDYVMLYSRRSANPSFGENPVMNDKDEMSLVFFNKSFNVQKNLLITDGRFNNLLHMARYGRNILIGYSLTTCLMDSNFVCSWVNDDDVSYLKLIDLDGNNLGEIRLRSLPGPDDFEVLADGRVAWITYERDNSLTYHYLTPPGQ